MSHEEAAQTVFQIEAKNKGWDTEGGEAAGEQDRQEEEGENGPEEQVAPSHLKLDPIQEKLLKASQQTAAPLAVQQAQAMEGKAGQAGQPGPQQHAAPRNSAAFRRQTVRKENRYIGICIFQCVQVGLLGPPPDGRGGPDAVWSGSPFGLGAGRETNGPLSRERIEAAGGRLPEPWEEDYIPPPDFPDNFHHQPKHRPDYTLDYQQDQPDYQAEAQGLEHDYNEEYRPDFKQDHEQELKEEYKQEKKNPEMKDETVREEDSSAGLAPPFNLSSLGLPPSNVLTNVLTAIKQNGSPDPAGRDPRRARSGQLRQGAGQEPEQEIVEEEEKDRRLLDLDLGSFFGDLELPPLAEEKSLSQEEKSLSDAFQLPFKPHIIHEVAKEIDASLGSHSPIEWNLFVIKVCIFS